MTRPVIRTARLRLRPVVRSDAAFITDALQDRAVWEWLSSIPQPYTEKDALHFVDHIAPSEAWMIEKDGVPQGVIGIGTELGYWLARAAWGQGIVTEAGRAVVDWAFSDPARTGLLSSHFDENDRSRRALEKLGFEDMGPKTISCLSDGRSVPSRKMALSRARWQALRPAGRETQPT